MAVLSPVDCRNAIKALIDTIGGVGKVYTRRRIVRTDIEFKNIFWDDTLKVPIGFMISPSPTNAAVVTRYPGHIGHGVAGGGNVFTTFQFQIEGIRTVDDANASETVFFDKCWSIIDTMNSYGSIPAAGGGKITGLEEQLPATMPEFRYIVFAGSPLCHYCRMEIGFLGRTRPV